MDAVLLSDTLPHTPVALTLPHTLIPTLSHTLTQLHAQQMSLVLDYIRLLTTTSSRCTGWVCMTRRGTSPRASSEAGHRAAPTRQRSGSHTHGAMRCVPTVLVSSIDWTDTRAHLKGTLSLFEGDRVWCQIVA